MFATHRLNSVDLYKDILKLNGCKSRRLRWVGHVAHTRNRKGAYRVLVGGGDQRKKTTREDYIKMNL